MENGNKPANPIFNENGQPTTRVDWLKEGVGLTKREEFAGRFMASYLTHYHDWADDDDLTEFAGRAIKAADILLKELDKPQG